MSCNLHKSSSQAKLFTGVHVFPKKDRCFLLKTAVYVYGKKISQHFSCQLFLKNRRMGKRVQLWGLVNSETTKTHKNPKLHEVARNVNSETTGTHP